MKMKILVSSSTRKIASIAFEELRRWLENIWKRDAGYIRNRKLKIQLPGMRKWGRPERRFMEVVSE